MNKIFLHYDIKFWEGSIRIYSNINGKFPWFLDRSVGNTYILMGFLTADFAKSLTNISS